MNNLYCDEKDILQLVALLKEHNIKRAVVSPGSTNISFAACLLYDKDFEVYSSVDERSAAYMACGIAAETGEPVIISCTGATAARNYAPALTEAFYRKLPILAVTSSQHFGRVGQYIPQVTDRTNPMNDIFKKNVQIAVSHTAEDEWANNLKINDALLELRRDGGGPVLINIETTFTQNFDVKFLPKVRKISRYYINDALPRIESHRVAVFVGSHLPFDDELTKAVDEFCEKYNAVVICDHTSNYFGEYRAFGGLLEWQSLYHPACRDPELVIHIGELSGAYYSFPKSTIWRVNPDGQIRDTFKGLVNVFAMRELDFFNKYSSQTNTEMKNTYYNEWLSEQNKVNSLLPELPFSNAWVAQQTASKLPSNSEMHFGILNSLRMWNLFETPDNVWGFSNVGGFGIDGNISTLIGASLISSSKLYFCVLGDLSTFYDLNSLGNRHVGNNVRILVINNGTGFEMRHKNNRGEIFKQDADILFAAAGHFGNKSRTVLKHFAEDLGFEYLSAETKDDYLKNLPLFISKEVREKPMIFEVFVDVEDEKKSFTLTSTVIQDATTAAKNAVKSILGEKGVKTVKGLLMKK